MPYKGFDINKDKEKQNNLDDYINEELQDIYTIIDNVKEELNDIDFDNFIKELKYNLGE